MSARAILPAELAKLRKDNQHSRLYLSIHKPAPVFKAQINQQFASLDMVAKLKYDNRTLGMAAHILPGMTLWVGTIEGAHDLGSVRVRAAANADTIYIGETSDVAFCDDAHLTVVDEFGIWARHPRLDSAHNYYMDWSIAYSNQHSSFAPVPAMGPPAVAWLTGADVTVGFDASQSWGLSGSGMTYSWTFPGASSTAGASTATPTATYAAPGTYRVALSVTRSGITSVGYRYVYVFSTADMPITQFELDSLSGDYERGGWEFGVTLYDQADVDAVRDGAQVVLFARDYYGGVEESLGAVAGRENIIAIGWIDGESINSNPIAGRVQFNITGPQAWLDKMSGFPVGFQNSALAPSAWTDIQDLTVDKALFSMLHHRSTLTSVTDVFLTRDTRKAAALEAPQGSLWSQILTIADETIFARPACNRYGQLWVQINHQYVPEGSRSSIPVVMDLTKQDWRDSLNIDYTPTPKVGRVELSGVAITSGPQAYFSLANGHTPKRHGSVYVQDNVLLSGQAQGNALAGLIMSANNAMWGFTVSAAANNRFVDIAPQQYIRISLLPGDTPHGIGYDGLAIVRTVTADFMSGSKTMLWEWQAEGASKEEIATDGDIPVHDSNGDFDFALKIPPFPPIAIPPFIPPSFPISDSPPRFVLLLTSTGLFFTETFADLTPTWISLNAGFAAQDYVDGLMHLDVNNNGQYYVATKRQIYSGMTGHPAALIRSEADMLAELPEMPPYYVKYAIYALGANQAAADEYAFVAGLGYPVGLSWMWRGSTAALTGKVALTEYANGYGSVSWGQSGIISTYQAKLGDSGIARVSFDGLDEDYYGLIAENPTFFYHARDISGADRILTLVGSGLLAKSRFLVDDGETVESELSAGLQQAAFEPGGLKMLAQVGTSAQKSIDGGQTFTPLIFPALNANNSVIQCVSADNYVWAAQANNNPVVLFTADSGSTWHNKIGNLREVAGANFIPRGIRVFP